MLNLQFTQSVFKMHARKRETGEHFQADLQENFTHIVRSLLDTFIVFTARF